MLSPVKKIRIKRVSIPHCNRMASGNARRFLCIPSPKEKKKKPLPLVERPYGTSVSIHSGGWTTARIGGDAVRTTSAILRKVESLSSALVLSKEVP